MRHRFAMDGGLEYLRNGLRNKAATLDAAMHRFLADLRLADLREV